MADVRSDEAVLFDFVEQWAEDVRSGGTPPLQHYLARFPGHERAIAREYLRLTGESEPSRASAVVTVSLPATDQLIDRLSRPRRTDERYELSEELARGGMGSILRARDRDLRRDVAMKVMLGHGSRQVARFLEEAQVTGQLGHPGIVPVHDLGVDENGRFFFTMRLVEGKDLREVIHLVHANEGGWTLGRALEVLLKVCDTVAFAHSRGVVHRDLKPSNVRVGEFGQDYVMDWGLAQVHERSTRTRNATVVSERAGERERIPDSPILTHEGDVIGTPSFMAPEQAEGRVGEVGPEVDVYAIGAMLYNLLTGTPPYFADGESPSSEEVLSRVRRGPPEPIVARRSDANPELVSICEKAMARDPGARYSNVREIAADLRAFLDGRVVRAHRTGAWVELAKWVSRNRALGSSVAGGVVLAVGLLATVAVIQSRDRARLQLLADANAPRALLAQIKEIVPSGPDEIDPLARWLDQARDLVTRREEHARELESMRSRALPFDPAQPRERAAHRKIELQIESLRQVRDFYRSELLRLEREGGLSDELLTGEEVKARIQAFEEHIERVETAPMERTDWTFSDPVEQLRFDALRALVPAMSQFLDTPDQDGWITRVERRLAFARTVEQRTILDAGAIWDKAIASIRDVSECPLYKGLSLRPQMGLIPLRRDARSGLWEFIHVASGAAPSEGRGGNWELRASTGIVLILIPGGPSVMGAQGEDPSRANYDPRAQPDESAQFQGRRIAVPGTLLPFFISKYEVTQAQWRRLAGHDSSACASPSYPEGTNVALHPAENVSWSEAHEVLLETGLKLPSEARWECAARGGTTTPWWTGEDRDSLRGNANLADASSARWVEVESSERADWPDHDDGFPATAPVGSFPPNAFGLHDVCGNVSEWCSDTGFLSYDSWANWHFGDLERRIAPQGLRIRRGGSCATRAGSCRSAARAFSSPDDVRPDTGLRPARDVEP